MADINLQTITIPTPEPYAASDPTKQQENFYYVQLQMLAQAKANELPFTLDAGSLSLAGLIAAIQDLRFNGQMIDLPGGRRVIFDHTNIQEIA